jgi:hypothetical protein
MVKSISKNYNCWRKNTLKKVYLQIAKNYGNNRRRIAGKRRTEGKNYPCKH